MIVCPQSSFQTSLPISSSICSISNEEGDLLFYSNGCEVFNALNERMPNGHSLSPGDIHDIVCQKYGYILPQSMVIIKSPRIDSSYYIIHLAATYDTSFKLMGGPLYFSKVDLTSDGGLGDITEKNKVIFLDSIESFSMVKHGNGKDWWIVAPILNSNKYHIGFIKSSDNY